MNWAPPVLSSSRLYQPLWSGPGVDDITEFYCISFHTFCFQLQKLLSAPRLTGPKTFPIDRLMAIFYSIVEERVAPSVNLFVQVLFLVSTYRVSGFIFLHISVVPSFTEEPPIFKLL